MRVLSGPSQSPDLNPVEHIWETLVCQVRKYRYLNKASVFKSLKEEWDKIQPTCINQLIESIPHRCAAVIAAKSVATKC